MKPDPALAHKQEAILCQTAMLGHAFANQHRLKLVSLLAQSSKTVEKLAQAIGQSVAATSAHLKVLRSAGVVTARKVGRHVHYQLRSEKAATFALDLRRLAEEVLPEVRDIMREYFENPESLSPLTERELLEEIKAGRVLVLDLRPEDEFAAGHLPRAIHIPLADLKERARHLPRKAKFLAYCRGPFCLTAVHGTDTLRAMGLDVRRLRFGVPEWKAARHPVERAIAQPNV
ncbi:MAG TPA: metalloregulator ArsR/SmtB family transcription factor [Clostridia bacterium]|nr:metalloregulator ArsR/SmtB family transcription factor [Clostridia bacterium]